MAAVTVFSLVGEGRFLSLKCEKLAVAAEGTLGEAGRRSAEGLGMGSRSWLAWPAQASRATVRIVRSGLD